MLRVIRPALPAMRARRAVSIVCVSSIMGIANGWDEHVHYSAAKAGVIGLMRGVAMELASDGVRANAIAPGYVRTAQSLSTVHSGGQAGPDPAAGFIPMGRVGEPDDVADVILFLASHAARYVTGQTVVVDGGLLAGRYRSRTHAFRQAAQPGVSDHHSTLIYASSATVSVTTETVRQIIEIARARNEWHNITGLLVFDHHNFLQAIEGRRDVVARLFASIMRDHRTPTSCCSGTARSTPAGSSAGRWGLPPRSRPIARRCYATA